MDDTFFGLKRGYYASLRVTRGALRRYGLTPARYDVLFAIDARFEASTQMGLRNVLGIARSTMTRMLTRMRELGLVTRTRAIDGRTWNLALTNEGRTRLRDAHYDLVLAGHIPLAVESALLPRGASLPHPDPAFQLDHEELFLCGYECLALIGRLKELLWCVRRQFGDLGSLGYNEVATST
jgi:DNA-binding MarR family transcriptional regulator